MAPTAVEWFAEASPKLHTGRVGGPWARHAELSAARDRERDADGPRQVRRDRRGLRDDVQVVAAEHLVPAAGDRFLGGRHHAEQHVAERVAAAALGGAGEEEAAGPVVQQRGIGRRSAAATAALPSWPAEPIV